MTLAAVMISIFIINLPFGYWRSNAKRLSPAWLAAIHIPIPIALAIRLLLLEWNWFLIPVFVATYAAGQLVGAWVGKWLRNAVR